MPFLRSKLSARLCARRSIFSVLAVAVVCSGGAASAARGQALVTASRIGDLQAGGGFTMAESDYNERIEGGTFYASYDIRPHYGVEVDFHQLSSSQTALYERSYEVGGRYLTRSFGNMHPYAKVLYGRGVLNVPLPRPNQNTAEANVAYNMFVGGGGVDFNIRPWLNARVDFEYQRWLAGPIITNGLTPFMGTVGVAYRFGSYKLNGRQWVLSAPKPEKPAKVSKDAPPPSGRQPLPPPAATP